VSWLVGAAGWLAAVATLIVLRRRLALVADAEHELRGAATALTLAAERLARDRRAARHAPLLGLQLDRMNAGLADLDAARHGRRPDSRPTAVDLGGAARAALTPWRAPLRTAGRSAAVDRRVAPVTIQADPWRLAQVLGNLVANAAEHGAGTVELRCRAAPEGARVEVRNRDRPNRPPKPGGGRGIPIAQRAARDLGGRLRVESRDGVTVARLDVPAARVNAPGAPAADSDAPAAGLSTPHVGGNAPAADPDAPPTGRDARRAGVDAPLTGRDAPRAGLDVPADPDAPDLRLDVLGRGRSRAA